VKKNISKILLLLVSLLIILGMGLVLTASSTYSQLKFDSVYHLFNSHLVRVLMAFFALIIFAKIPYTFYKKHTKKIISVVVFLLLFTFIVATRVKGASRWLNFYLFSVQPSEIAKIALLMHLSYMIEKKEDLIKDFKKGYVFLLFWILLVSALVLIQPNVSTSIIIIVLSFTLLYVGGARFKHIISTIGILVIVGGAVIMIFPHSRERVLSFFNALLNGTDINIQVTQAKIGLGSGGWLGVGLGKSGQADLFLPEAYGDFIFSVLGEQLGFIGSFFVLSIYMMIFLIGIYIAKNAVDDFGQLLAFGLAFNIVISAFINASVVIGLLPTTGITLPFISYGGTSITFMCASIGIILNISKHSIRKNLIRKKELY